MPSMKEDAFWRSLGELAETDEFKKHLELELPGHDAENPSSVDRRRFLQLMGASVALAGMQACRFEQEKILPMVTREPGTTPGVPRRFATSMELGGVGRPLLVTSYDGRPTKIEGNPLHAASLGSSDVFSQASILGLCDPERAQQVWGPVGGEGRKAMSRADFEKAIRNTVDALKGKGTRLAFLSESTSSMAVAAQRDRVMKAFPGATWTSYESISLDNMKKGAEMAFGQPYRAHYDLTKAKVIVALDADLFGNYPDQQRLSREWAEGRDPEQGDMNRFYAVESRFSSTGSVADNRLPLPSHLVASFAASLLDRVEGRGAGAAEDTTVKAFLQALSEDLVSNRGAAVVIAGPSQPPEVHALAHRINDALDGLGKTVKYSLQAWDDAGPEGLAALTKKMAAGDVDTLFILGGNPVFDAPADIDFAGALDKVPHAVHLSHYDDETARRCEWLVPRAHFLESWGDSRAWDGSVTLTQPLIAPLYADCVSAAELLAIVAGDKNPKGADLVKTALGSMASGNAWRKSLHDGFIASSESTNPSPRAKTPAAGSFERKPLKLDGDMEIVFTPCSKVYDGRFANNGWLQELPDFMSKLTWDNAAHMSPATADKFGVGHGDMVELEVTGRKMKAPVYVMPGHAANSVSIAIGYGRSEAGTVGGSKAEGIDAVGFDVSAIRTSVAPYFATGAKMKSLGEEHELACTQEHFAIDDMAEQGIAERLPQLVRSTTLDHYNDGHKDFAQHAVHHPPLVSAFEDQEYTGEYKWGMGIDLNKCTGCNSCVIACQSENNIPIVGKEDVLKGREMHWLRIDRYFTGDPETARAVAQPLTCQHCELAPCEQVCPVAATVHSDEGLNDMVYNRCVGTRYCANNCPYKVRRFNFFNYNKDLYDPKNEVQSLTKNPEVTVRARGVMEKCTFCVQRIKAVKQTLRVEKRELRDGDVQVACQESCPTSAITFGDLNDKDSAVSKAHMDLRSYALLQELNIRPRNLFLAEVRNPNPVLEKGKHS